MNARLYDRIAAALGLLLLGILAGVTFYLAEMVSRDPKTIPIDKTKHEIDYFVNNFTLIKLNELGKPTFRLSAKELVHYPDDDSSELLKPTMVSLDPAKPKLTITSEKGKAIGRADQTELMENVVIVRKGLVKNEAPLQINTEYVAIDSRTETATTDAPVTAVQGTSTLAGTGMDLDNIKRTLIVRSEVKTSFRPAGSKAPAQPSSQTQTKN